jgi:triphosphoribosyl-dephospho-CoA synthase
MLTGEAVAAAYLQACLAELAALKPGNVHVFADGHGMTTADFETSARVSAPIMGRRNLSVGARILAMIEATQAAVHCNTNLGIVLLCAPLAAAAVLPGGGLRERLQQVLGRLDLADADSAFAAIRLAAPAGLGEQPAHDVRQPATVSLLAAMRAAGERDRIAHQYGTAYADVFEIGAPVYRTARARWTSEAWATTATYLAFLAGFPDTHIARKYGTLQAERVSVAARPLAARLQDAADPAMLAADLLAFDADLKGAGLNPGTSADLTVASLFAVRLDDAAEAAARH